MSLESQMLVFRELYAEIAIEMTQKKKKKGANDDREPLQA